MNQRELVMQPTRVEVELHHLNGVRLTVLLAEAEDDDRREVTLHDHFDNLVAIAALCRANDKQHCIPLIQTISIQINLDQRLYLQTSNVDIKWIFSATQPVNQVSDLSCRLSVPFDRLSRRHRHPSRRPSQC